MGVRGLTSFVARNAEIYLHPYELHDCNLVIDGDNLACSLYKDVTGANSAFGGDYDVFYRAVLKFFHVLAECNIHSFVLMDGGREAKKLRTVGKRLRGKIAVIKRINPCGSVPIFPVMMKEVFVDAVRECDIPVMRCIFEADDELAALSRKLNCPVLSYDSDFYIHNVRYIPLITVTVKAHTRQVPKEQDDQGSTEDDPRKLRQNEAKKIQKRTKANRILSDIQVDAVEKRTAQGCKTYKYLDCCMYKIENLIARGSLSKEKLPLFAALLGNDYISSSSFKNFFTSIGRGKGSKKLSQQQRRINTIMQWLRHETAQSALRKILARLRMNQRESLLAQINAATSGYSNERSVSYDFFITNHKTALYNFPHIDEDETEQLEEEEDEDESLTESELGNFQENDADKETEGESEVDEDEDNFSEDLSENAEEVELNSEDKEHLPDVNDENEKADDDHGDITQLFPVWFLKRLYPANLPRFCVDLMHLKKYINDPQIEHFPHNDCNEIALPILIYIFTLLQNVEGEHRPISKAEDGTEIPIEFTYLTRATRVTNIRYIRYAAESTPPYVFNPHSPNPLLIRRVFTNTMHQIDVDLLFTRLELLPPDLHLYFLAIVYWLQKSQHCDLLHLHALIICLVILRTIDAKIPAERDLKAFQKRFGKIVKKERLVRDKEAQEGITRGVKDELKVLSIPERMPSIPKSDCLLVQHNMLKHFHMQELFKKKYDLYSTIVIHPFAEFQCLVFQLHSLNALLKFPLAPVHINELYCGVLLYNIYDLLRDRLDIRYYVRQFIFRDSQMMYDFYAYLLDWCEEFLPEWKRGELKTQQSALKKMMKKRRQLERKKAAKARDAAVVDPNADMLEKENEDEEEFFDSNNIFCLLKSRK